jgi:hypothetical protein
VDLGRSARRAIALCELQPSQEDRDAALPESPTQTAAPALAGGAETQVYDTGGYKAPTDSASIAQVLHVPGQLRRVAAGWRQQSGQCVGVSLLVGSCLVCGAQRRATLSLHAPPGFLGPPPPGLAWASPPSHSWEQHQRQLHLVPVPAFTVCTHRGGQSSQRQGCWLRAASLLRRHCHYCHCWGGLCGCWRSCRCSRTPPGTLRLALDLENQLGCCLLPGHPGKEGRQRRRAVLCCTGRGGCRLRQQEQHGAGGRRASSRHTQTLCQQCSAREPRLRHPLILPHRLPRRQRRRWSLLLRHHLIPQPGQHGDGCQLCHLPPAVLAPPAQHISRRVDDAAGVGKLAVAGLCRWWGGANQAVWAMQ